MDLEQFNSGDIILFNGKKYIISRMIEYILGSKWSHVGIILKDPIFIHADLKGYYLLESGSEPFKDCDENIQKFGVQIVKLEDKINEYQGDIHVRKLQKPIDNFNQKMELIYNTIKDKPYDLSFFDFLGLKLKIQHNNIISKNPIINWFFPSHRKTDTFVCSALVAYIYTELGLLPKDTNWSQCMPATFSQENNLQLIDNTLSSEIVVKNC